MIGRLYMAHPQRMLWSRVMWLHFKLQSISASPQTFCNWNAHKLQYACPLPHLHLIMSTNICQCVFYTLHKLTGTLLPLVLRITLSFRTLLHTDVYPELESLWRMWSMIRISGKHAWIVWKSDECKHLLSPSIKVNCKWRESYGGW